jgi:hypothetical protein
MHRRFIIKKTWLSALGYAHIAQSLISLVFPCSLGFLVPWLSSLTDKTDLADFVYGEEGGRGDFVCWQNLYLTVTDMFKYLLCYVQL